MKKRFTKIGALILSAVMLGGTILGGCGASDKKESGSETVSKDCLLYTSQAVYGHLPAVLCSGAVERMVERLSVYQ